MARRLAPLARRPQTAAQPWAPGTVPTVALLMQRAQAVRLALSPTTENPSAVLTTAAQDSRGLRDCGLG